MTRPYTNLITITYIPPNMLVSEQGSRFTMKTKTLDATIPIQSGSDNSQRLARNQRKRNTTIIVTSSDTS